MNIPGHGEFRSKLQKVPRVLFFIVPILLLLGWYIFSIRQLDFQKDYSTILEDRNGRLLGAGLSRDGQWRFPAVDSLSANYLTCLLTFEDKRFYTHHGVDIRALGRAIRQNISAGEVKSGGSTISMQVVRMCYPGKQRSLAQKLLEIILATRLEFSYSKEEILRLYTSDAPFGGNVRGIEAASWRYFGRNPYELSWAENALLAVLPNSPSLLHPGKNRERLLAKRNRLLNRLYSLGRLDSTGLVLALSEPLPEKPHALPRMAPHVLQRMMREHEGERIRTSLDASLQQRALEVLRLHQPVFAGNGIYNAAVIIAEAETGNILVYHGNSVPQDSSVHAGDVDIIRSPRSYGSLLKPVLYASMLDEGLILPGTLVADIPTDIAGFSPKNYEETYDGAVPARRALTRSLNVPAVRMLQKYGYEKFHRRLQQLGLASLNYPAEHYGLSIILGGGEASLWELTSLYASLTRVLLHFESYNGWYDRQDYRQLNLFADSVQPTPPRLSKPDDPAILRAASIWLTYQALVEVNRPDAEAFWNVFSSRRPVAWKTGTSFGNRDGWAIGTNGRFVVGVWVGNADGEGRPLLTGIGCAAPVLFGMLEILPQSEWFEQPFDEMVKIPVCRQSGYRPSRFCQEVDSVWITESGLRTSACPYHIQVHLDATGRYRINAGCRGSEPMNTTSWFVLPPAMEWFYKHKNQQYRRLPPVRPDCQGAEEGGSMEILYPMQGSRVYVPTELSGRKGQVVIEAIHRNPAARIFWQLDDQYAGMTMAFHQIAVQPGKGKHRITLVDEKGETLSSTFEVLEKE
ncbi:MAG: penicillin-binding protein 1C [Bacteroidales bacterium]